MRVHHHHHVRVHHDHGYVRVMVFFSGRAQLKVSRAVQRLSEGGEGFSWWGSAVQLFQPINQSIYQSINLPINQLIRWSSVQGVSNVNVFPSIPSGGSYPITSPMSPTTFPEFCSVVTTIGLPVHSDQPFLPQSLPFQLSHHLIFFVQDRF